MYQTQSWDRPRRIIAKVEWHCGELFPRVGFIVTNLDWTPQEVVTFYNQRGTAEQWIKEGQQAIRFQARTRINILALWKGDHHNFALTRQV